MMFHRHMRSKTLLRALRAHVLLSTATSHLISIRSHLNSIHGQFAWFCSPLDSIGHNQTSETWSVNMGMGPLLFSCKWDAFHCNVKLSQTLHSNEGEMLYYSVYGKIPNSCPRGRGVSSHVAQRKMVVTTLNMLYLRGRRTG